MTAAPKRILLLQLHHLGDVLLTTPAIRATRAAFPDAIIDFVTSPLGTQALEDNPHLDSVLLPKMWRVLRRRYDFAVDFHSVPRSARVVAASRARVRIGLRGRQAVAITPAAGGAWVLTSDGRALLVLG